MIIIKKLVALILCTAVISLCGCGHKHYYDKWQTSFSNCVTDGYMYRTCHLCGEVEYGDVVTTAGHVFTQWQDDIVNEVRYGTCSLCGVVEENGEYQPVKDFPRIHIYGTPSGTVIPVEAMYSVDEDILFYGNISIDGNESNEYYKKDYDVPFDIGYAGSPKYEVSIYNSDLKGVLDEDMSTSKTTKTRTIKIEDYTTNLKNTKLRLTFSTDNIQNIIYFKNITVQYTCVRYK